MQCMAQRFDFCLLLKASLPHNTGLTTWYSLVEQSSCPPDRSTRGLCNCYE